MFLNPNNIFAIWFTIVTVPLLFCTNFFKFDFPKIKYRSTGIYLIECPQGEWDKKAFGYKNSKNFANWFFFSQSLKHFFSHSRSEQNTISWLVAKVLLPSIWITFFQRNNMLQQYFTKKNGLLLNPQIIFNEFLMTDPGIIILTCCVDSATAV